MKFLKNVYNKNMVYDDSFLKNRKEFESATFFLSN